MTGDPRRSHLCTAGRGPSMISETPVLPPAPEVPLMPSDADMLLSARLADAAPNPLTPTAAGSDRRSMAVSIVSPSVRKASLVPFMAVSYEDPDGAAGGR